MALIVEKAAGIGFCFGVRRCIDILEKAAREHGRVESLGAPVHNHQVLTGLASSGVHIARTMDEIKGNVAAISAHGVGPLVESELRARFDRVLDTTCPFVRRAHIAARRLTKAGFFVVVYGEADHPEVKGILGWANDYGLATLDYDFVLTNKLPRRLGILSQTTSVSPRFAEFTKKVIDSTLVRDAEIRITDTICHDFRERQESALNLARKAEIMLVVGSHTSANTKHLVELCATVTKTRLVETDAEIKKDWFKGRSRVGVTSGASTPDETISKVLSRLKEIA